LLNQLFNKRATRISGTYNVHQRIESGLTWWSRNFNSIRRDEITEKRRCLWFWSWCM